MPYAVPIGDSKINPKNLPLPQSKGSFINPDDFDRYEVISRICRSGLNMLINKSFKFYPIENAGD